MLTTPRHAFRPHPVLGWSLTPGARITVPHRENVIQTIGPDGWRNVPEQTESPEFNLAFYGCSFTYGTGLADEETFPALVQADFRAVRVQNRGVGGHGTLQNLLQFRRDVADGMVQAAVFGIISDHRFRNFPHSHRFWHYLNSDWYRRGIEHVPIVRRDRRGELAIDYAPIWQPSMLRQDFDIFLPDDRMTDEIMCAILDETSSFAAAHRIPIVFALLDQLDEELNATIAGRFVEALDISVPFDEEHIFIPADIHPNPYSNKLYASRLATPIRERLLRPGKNVS
jgi:hypothetical protein